MLFCNQQHNQIKKDIKDWVQELLKIRKTRTVDSRKACADSVAKQGFDIREQSKKLEKLLYKIK